MYVLAFYNAVQNRKKSEIALEYWRFRIFDRLTEMKIFDDNFYDLWSREMKLGLTGNFLMLYQMPHEN